MPRVLLSVPDRGACSRTQCQEANGSLEFLCLGKQVWLCPYALHPRVPPATVTAMGSANSHVHKTMNLLCVSALTSYPCRAPSDTLTGPLHCLSQAPKMKGGELPAPELRGWIGAPGMTTPKLCMTHPLTLTPWKLNNESGVLATLFTSQGAYLRYPGTEGCCCCTSLNGTWQPSEYRSSTG